MAGEGNSATTFRDLQPLKRCRRRGFIGSINEVLPDDTLVQILCCLPCQSAVTCKLVCKRWLSLISTPSFISSSISHRRQIQQQHDHDDDQKYDPMILKAHGRYLFLTSQLLNSDISFTFLPNNPILSSVYMFEIEIVASSDDLFLCTRRPSFFGSPYFICNPFTKEWFELPPFPPSKRFVEPYTLYVYGFTHKPYYHCVEGSAVVVNSSCRFCVVRLKVIIDGPLGNSFRGASEFEVDVFSSETWQWTTCMMHHSSRPNTPSSCISRNGLLYWLCDPGQVIIHDPYNNTVCYVVDQFRPDDRRYCHGFSVSQGSLYAFDKLSTEVVTVWELEDDQEDQQPKWRFVTRSVELKSILMTAIAVHPNDKNIIYFQTGSGGIITLSLRTGKFKCRSIQELVTTGNYGYEVRRFKVAADEIEMVVFKAPCGPLQYLHFSNQGSWLASSTLMHPMTN